LKKKKLNRKKKFNKTRSGELKTRSGGIPQVVEHQPSKNETLSSSPNTTRQKPKNKNRSGGAEEENHELKFSNENFN
jgi:hypothetical protein